MMMAKKPMGNNPFGKKAHKEGDADNQPGYKGKGDMDADNNFKKPRGPVPLPPMKKTIPPAKKQMAPFQPGGPPLTTGTPNGKPNPTTKNVVGKTAPKAPPRPAFGGKQAPPFGKAPAAKKKGK
jgi:hypothetical protein